MITLAVMQSPALLSGFPFMYPVFFPSYRAIQWGIAMVADDGEQLTNLIITVKQSGSGITIATFRRAPKVHYTVGMTELYYFEIDVSAIAQSMVAPLAGDISSTFLGYDDSSHNTLYIEIIAEYIAAGGIFIQQYETLWDTENEPTNVTSSTANSDLIQLSDNNYYFIGTNRTGQFWNELGGYNTINPVNWATDTPEKNETCLDYIGYLHYLNPNFVCAVIINVTHADGSTDDYTPEFLAPSNITKAIPSTPFIITDQYGINIVEGDTYVVRVVQFPLGVDLVPPITYKVVDCCEPHRKSICLTFLNKYGFSDTVLLKGRVLRLQNTASEIARKPLGYSQASHAFGSYDVGEIRYETTGQQGFSIETDVPQKTALWLRDLFRSPETYYQIPYSIGGGGTLNNIPCRVVDVSGQPVSTNANAKVPIKINVLFSNPDVIQNF